MSRFESATAAIAVSLACLSYRALSSNSARATSCGCVNRSLLSVSRVLATWGFNPRFSRRSSAADSSIVFALLTTPPLGHTISTMGAANSPVRRSRMSWWAWPPS